MYGYIEIEILLRGETSLEEVSAGNFRIAKTAGFYH